MMLKAPTTTETPTFERIEEGLRRAEASTDAAEAHGSLCGLVCGLGAGGQSTWLAETLADAQAGEPASRQAGALLEALAASTRAALEGAEMTFQPLLPDDSEPLVERVDCLAQWCQGFNHGLFVAGRIADAEAELGSGNTAEIIRDFGEMAQVSVGEEEADPEGEAAYAELVEYVRVSVQLVYEELSDVRQRVQSAGIH
ncbi:MAG: UPF0149 family protein [Chromatiales bacterium]|nr:UPF0149 family protein [Chromatiales bacterium]